MQTSSFYKESRVAKSDKIYEVDTKGMLIETTQFTPPRCPYCSSFKQNFEFKDRTIWCCPKKKCIEEFDRLSPLLWKQYPLNFLRHLGKKNEFCTAKFNKDPTQEDFEKHWAELKNGKIKDIYVSGEVGVGKTYCLYAALHEVCRCQDQYESLILTENEMFSMIKASWKDETEESILDKITSVDFLFLDDLGGALKTVTGEWGNQTLLEILDDRLNSVSLRTIVSSNYSISEINQVYDLRIADRLIKMNPCFISGTSKRKHIKIEEKERRSS